MNIGTDKELSDLLDFSAVSFRKLTINHIYFISLWIVNSLERTHYWMIIDPK